jgi:uncharacterized protein with HEPN domain
MIEPASADIEDAIVAAMKFTCGRSRSELGTDLMLQFALMQAVQIVGEAARNVSAGTMAIAPDIPWPVIGGMRNRLMHINPFWRPTLSS